MGHYILLPFCQGCGVPVSDTSYGGCHVNVCPRCGTLPVWSWSGLFWWNKAAFRRAGWFWNLRWEKASTPACAGSERA